MIVVPIVGRAALDDSEARAAGVDILVGGRGRCGAIVVLRDNLAAGVDEDGAEGGAGAVVNAFLDAVAVAVEDVGARCGAVGRAGGVVFGVEGKGVRF
jgi:hypothetical protein